jgi:large subunit ribosomal protein L18
MNIQRALNNVRSRRQARSRARINGTSKRPRLAVFRSNASIYAQLIDDEAGRTIVSASGREVKDKIKKAAKSEIAKQVGELLAKKAKAAGVQAAVFDRRGYKYHGRVKALSDGARSGGLVI